MVEKRRYTRVMFLTKAVVEAGGISITGTVHNLCLNGMFFTGPDLDSLRDGADVVVAIMIEGRSSILTSRIHGRILRHQKNGIAIQFNPRTVGLDSLLLLKTVIVSNGGDREKIEDEFRTILRAEEDRHRVLKPHPTSKK